MDLVPLLCAFLDKRSLVSANATCLGWRQATADVELVLRLQYLLVLKRSWHPLLPSTAARLCSLPDHGQHVLVGGQTPLERFLCHKVFDFTPNVTAGLCHVVEAFLEAGYNINATNARGHTVLCSLDRACAVAERHCVKRYADHRPRLLEHRRLWNELRRFLFDNGASETSST